MKIQDSQEPPPTAAWRLRQIEVFGTWWLYRSLNPGYSKWLCWSSNLSISYNFLSIAVYCIYYEYPPSWSSFPNKAWYNNFLLFSLFQYPIKKHGDATDWTRRCTAFNHLIRGYNTYENSQTCKKSIVRYPFWGRRIWYSRDLFRRASFRSRLLDGMRWTKNSKTFDSVLGAYYWPLVMVI